MANDIYNNKPIRNLMFYSSDNEKFNDVAKNYIKDLQDSVMYHSFGKQESFTSYTIPLYDAFIDSALTELEVIKALEKKTSNTNSIYSRLVGETSPDLWVNYWNSEASQRELQKLFFGEQLFESVQRGHNHPLFKLFTSNIYTSKLLANNLISPSLDKNVKKILFDKAVNRQIALDLNTVYKDIPSTIFNELNGLFGEKSPFPNIQTYGEFVQKAIEDKKKDNENKNIDIANFITKPFLTSYLRYINKNLKNTNKKFRNDFRGWIKGTDIFMELSIDIEDRIEIIKQSKLTHDIDFSIALAKRYLEVLCDTIGKLNKSDLISIANSQGNKDYHWPEISELQKMFKKYFYTESFILSLARVFRSTKELWKIFQGIGGSGNNASGNVGEFISAALIKQTLNQAQIAVAGSEQGGTGDTAVDISGRLTTSKKNSQGKMKEVLVAFGFQVKNYTNFQDLYSDVSETYNKKTGEYYKEKSTGLKSIERYFGEKIAEDYLTLVANKIWCDEHKVPLSIDTFETPFYNNLANFLRWDDLTYQTNKFKNRYKNNFYLVGFRIIPASYIFAKLYIALSKGEKQLKFTNKDNYKQGLFKFYYNFPDPLTPPDTKPDPNSPITGPATIPVVRTKYLNSAVTYVFSGIHKKDVADLFNFK